MSQDELIVSGAPVSATNPLPVNGGDLSASAETDPAAASASTNALLRGILAALGTAADDAGDDTVIGQLKQIAVNTTPA
jgi:hypothetical protein